MKDFAIYLRRAQATTSQIAILIQNLEEASTLDQCLSKNATMTGENIAQNLPRLDPATERKKIILCQNPTAFHLPPPPPPPPPPGHVEDRYHNKQVTPISSTDQLGTLGGPVSQRTSHAHHVNGPAWDTWRTCVTTNKPRPSRQRTSLGHLEDLYHDKQATPIRSTCPCSERGLERKCKCIYTVRIPSCS